LPKVAAVPVVAMMIVLAAEWPSADRRDPLPVPDVAGYHTLKCDLHIHTVFSDGNIWPTTRVIEAWREGLDVIALSDHDDYRPYKDDVSLDLGRPHAIASPLAGQLRMLLVPAVEITRGDIHFNALFVEDHNAFAGLGLADALREAGAQKAFVFYNHPGWRAKPEWLPEVAAAHLQGQVHGVELVNGPTYYPEVFPWIDEKKLAIIATSDIHDPVSPRDAPRSRTITLAFARTPDLDGVREALFERRTVGWMGGRLWGAEQWLRGLWDGAVEVMQPGIRVEQGAQRATVFLRNRSAIPFQARVVKSPEWLTGRAATIHPESVSTLILSIPKDTVLKPGSVELELELTNLHCAPDRNLVVRLPLTVHVIGVAS
jgi:3',5'-nucleoside bisphosphate phosphatase